MQTAIIPPIDLLTEKLVESQEMYMFLPHLLDREEYRAHITRCEGYRILDNGAAEGTTYEFDALNSIAATFYIDEVVIPDVIGDCDLTIELARWAGSAAKPQGVKWMAVVQGQKISEVLKCWREMLRLEWVDVIGVPRHLNKYHPTARFALIQSLRQMSTPDEDFFAKPVHALGSHSWVSEVAALARLGCVRSIDTSLPLHMAQLGESLRTAQEGQKRPADYFEHRWTQEEVVMARDNIRVFQHWATAP